MEEYRITVFREGKEKSVEVAAGTSLLSSLTAHGVYVSASCGGKGRCGKCGVRMVVGATEVTEADRSFFDEKQLAQGMRLACESYPTENCRVVIESGDEADFEIVTEYRGRQPAVEYLSMTGNIPDTRYDIAIDIGTTTIAVSLADSAVKRMLHTVTVINHQRAYGADVISRIQAANEGKLAELSRCIRNDLYESMRQLLKEAGTGFSGIRRICIAGNTTMQHLLMEYSCETLGVYPFEPVDISLTRTSFSKLFSGISAKCKKNTVRDTEDCGAPGDYREEGYDIDVILLPGISAYVGADIAAGLLSCGFDRAEQVNVLIDLGTNGEMAIGNREKILVTSTAAGPAFEGGNISCGMGSVQGAVCQVEIDGTDAVCTTIGGKAPLGLCGTGVIETAYELLKEEWIDETGLLDEDYFDDGFVLVQTPEGEDIVFTQRDVREIQLAKSAVRAGLETLLLRYGVTYEEIGTLFLAGGFGYRMNLKKAAGIGLLPEELLEKTVAVGNSSLEGAAEFLSDAESAARMERIIRVSEEIPLASDKDFNRLYTDYMLFE